MLDLPAPVRPTIPTCKAKCSMVRVNSAAAASCNLLARLDRAADAFDYEIEPLAIASGVVVK